MNKARPVTDQPEQALSCAAGELNMRKWTGALYPYKKGWNGLISRQTGRRRPAHHPVIFALCLCASVVFISGCATKGGWPCWAWQKNTDQKTRAMAEQQGLPVQGNK